MQFSTANDNHIAGFGNIGMPAHHKITAAFGHPTNFYTIMPMQFSFKSFE